MDAEALEPVVLEAALKTAEEAGLMDEAIAEFFAHHLNADRLRVRDELTGLLGEIKRTEEGIQRYFAAFESGGMPAGTCAARVDALGTKLLGLKARQDELEVSIGTAAPASADLAEATRLIQDLAEGPGPQLKAVLQHLVEEVRITSRRSVRPVFRMNASNSHREGGEEDRAARSRPIAC